MAYTDVDFKSKKDFKEAVKSGKKVRLYNPSGMFPTKENGVEFVEGPHFPKPHTWYAKVEVKDGVVISIK
jgi:hypothetical protein